MQKVEHFVDGMETQIMLLIGEKMAMKFGLSKNPVVPTLSIISSQLSLTPL